LDADRAPQLKAVVGLLSLLIELDPMRLMKSIVISLLGAMVISCVRSHPEPSVVIKQGNPQQFIVSATGTLDVFSVSGPVRRCETESNEHGLLPMERYWEIAPLTDFDVSQFKKLGAIIYGRVPEGFRQVTPVNGAPPPICKGYPYSVQLAIRDGDGVNMLFAVYDDGKIVTEADED
jgi:hypothetical protein